MDLLIIISILLILLLAFISFFAKYRKKINKKDKLYFLNKINEIQSNKNYHKALMDADILTDKILYKLGYIGTLANKFKKLGNNENMNRIWNAHKLRNKIAHEMDIKINDKEIKNSINILLKFSEKLIK